MNRKKTVETAYWLLVCVGILPAIWISADFISGGSHIPYSINFTDPLYAVVFILLFMVFTVICFLQSQSWRLILGLPLLILGIIPAYASLIVGEPASRIAVPIDAVVAFARTSCPTGWDYYQKAAGRFIRGIDKTGRKVDPDGERKHGTEQSDSIITHKHKIGEHTPAPGGGDGMVLGYVYGTKRYTEPTDDGPADKVSVETRPKNVALLFCVRRELRQAQKK